jgi:late competence protein required for DNA uptake (superfamily II DNA/RNA helicase)
MAPCKADLGRTPLKLVKWQSVQRKSQAKYVLFVAALKFGIVRKSLDKLPADFSHLAILRVAARSLRRQQRIEFLAFIRNGDFEML